MIAFRVVRGTPRRAAVALTTPPVSRSTRIDVVAFDFFERERADRL